MEMDSVLLAVCGLSPQIFTETLYALWRDGRFPSRAILLTTRQGEALVHEKLLGGGGAVAAFLRDYGLPMSMQPLSPQDILVPRCCGRPVEDISTMEESEAFQELAMRLAWGLTQDASRRVDFSIAGGRKTMSASLALAAQCYGRETDRMFHVLAAAHCEADKRFFYPLPDEQTAAHITLAPVPFPRLRPHLPAHFLRQPCRPQTLLSHFGDAQAPSLLVHVRQRRVSIGGRSCTLPPALFALFLWFAMRKESFPCNGNCAACHARPCFTDSAELLKDSRSIAGLYEKIRGTGATGSGTGILDLDQENFLAYKAKLNRRLRRDLGALAEYAEIVSIGMRPNVRYGLRIARPYMLIEGC